MNPFDLGIPPYLEGEQALLTAERWRALKLPKPAPKPPPRWRRCGYCGRSGSPDADNQCKGCGAPR